jgi:hypothetical protein
MASKRFKGKDCAYCGGQGIASTADHVVAREFFFEEDRADLPQVAACRACNNQKSALEHYVSAALMVGSNLADGDRYRQERVRPRIAKNRKLQEELGLNDPPVWICRNGIWQLVHAIKLRPTKITGLMALIVKGLYCFHFGRPLCRDFWADVAMIHPQEEPALWAGVAGYFPPGSKKFSSDLGRGTFFYECSQSPAHADFSIWRMAWHGGISLHGDNTPPQGVSVFWCFTRPTEEAVAAAEHRMSSASDIDPDGET